MSSGECLNVWCRMCPCIPTLRGPGYRRYVVAGMLCLGMVCVMIMRCELGMAMLELTTTSHPVPLSTAKEETGEMLNYHTRPKASPIHSRIERWSRQKVGMIEAALFLGYASFSVPGGVLATFIRPHLVFGCAIVVTCSVNLLITSAVHLSQSFVLVVALRVIQGAAEGCLLPTAHALFRYWAPVGERSRLVSISFFGLALGPIIGYPLTGFLIQKFHWSTPFHVFGILGLLWAIVWFFCVRSRPADDVVISPEEVAYIESSCSCATEASVHQGGIRGVPWKSILTSLPVWAIVLANMGRNWIFQFSFSGLPKYFNDSYQLNEEQIGLHMMPGYVLIAVLTLLGGCLADIIYRTTRLSLGNVRKLFNGVGFSVSALSFLLLGFSHALWLSTLLLTLGMGFFGFAMSGFGVNHLDIAPQFAGILMGLSAGIGTVSGIISPLVATHLVQNSQPQEWRSFFLTSAAIIIICNAFYLCFASGELQSWASPEGGGKDEADRRAPREPIMQHDTADTYGAIQDTDLDLGTSDKYPIVQGEAKME